MKYIRIIGKIDRPKTILLGGKGWSLTILSANGYQVPNGFILTIDAYLDTLKCNDIQNYINNITKQINEKNYRKFSKNLKALILKCKIPDDIKKEIDDALGILRANYISIRSSAISEDSMKESFAGLHDSFINVKSELNSVLYYVKKCWASLFNERSIIYRIKKGIPLLDGMAVVIQEMIDSDVSGIAFTDHPLQKDVMLVESAYGLGTLIVGGEITPDSFIISRNNLSIVGASIGNKHRMCKVNEAGNLVVIDVLSPEKDLPSISTERLKELSKICLDFEKLFEHPQDIEWCLYSNKIYILQSRAITMITPTERTSQAEELKEIEAEERNTQVLTGIPASLGKVRGNVKIIEDNTDIKKVKAGNILVTPRATPKILSVINKVSGIISEEGSIISHAAIIAREFMIPCVVGVEKATQILSDNLTVEVDGVAGKIYILNHELNVGLSLLKEQSTKLDASKSTQEKTASLPNLEDLADITQLIENGKITLSPMGKRVVQTPNFVNKWKNFILSLKPEKIVESWRDTLGKFLAFLAEINNKDISINFLDKLVTIHNDFYMYNLLTDCYDSYPLFRQIVNKYTVPLLNSRIIEFLIDYSIEYKISYNQLKSSVYLPLPSRYIPIGMHRTEDISYKNLLIELSRAYALDKKKYVAMLSELERGELDALGLTIKIPKSDNIRKHAYEIFLNILLNKEKEEFKLCVELIEHFGIMNDINRLVGKEFAEEAKKVVDSLKCCINIEFESDWPWEQLLELYTKLHSRRDKLGR